MKFIKLYNRRGFNHDHGTRYSVTDLQRSGEVVNYEAGTNRLPRCDSKYWSHRYMVWDVAANAVAVPNGGGK